MRKQSLFLLPHFFLTSLFSAKKMKGMMYRVYFFRREFWKYHAVQTAELLFIITGDMNISAYGALYRYDGNGIGSPFNQLFKSDKGVAVKDIRICSFSFPLNSQIIGAAGNTGKTYRNGIILGTAKKAF